MPSVSASDQNSFSIDSGLDQHLVGGQGVEQLQRRAVLDAFADRILVQVAFRHIVHAKSLKSPLAVGRAVNGRAGKADHRGVGQAGKEVVPQVAARAAVGLVDQHVKRPRVQMPAGISLNLWIIETMMPR